MCCKAASGGFSEYVDCSPRRNGTGQHLVKNRFQSGLPLRHRPRPRNTHAKDDSLQYLQNLTDLRGADPCLSNARHMGDYQMWLQFADGRAGIVDFSDDLWGAELEPLRDRVTFEEI